jgi:tetratricopeptide (TPR) repeat protein
VTGEAWRVRDTAQAGKVAPLPAGNIATVRKSAAGEFCQIKESPMRLAILTLIAASSIMAMPVALAASSGGPMSGGGSDMSPPREQTPKEKARSAYNEGLRAVRKADNQAAAAEKATDERKKEKAAKKSAELYERARESFTLAVQNVDTMHEAWNYLGYTRRKLGEYDAALTAYDRALALRPSYPEAIEYRGEAYLGLNRVEEAKQAYLDLYAGNRKLADQLLVAMKSYVAAKRAAAPADPAALDALDTWVQEREQIAGQTASLTRSGGESWR